MLIKSFGSREQKQKNKRIQKKKKNMIYKTKRKEEKQNVFTAQLKMPQQTISLMTKC